MAPGGRPPGSNPIAWVFEQLLSFALSLFRALWAGIVGAPSTAARAVTEPIQIRRGDPEEVLAVRHSVLRPGRPAQDARFEGDALPATRHWVAERLGMVVAVVSVTPQALPDEVPFTGPPPRWRLRGMAVLPEYRGRGLGGAMLQAVHDEVGEPMWCNARSGAIDFYARRGWRPLGAPFSLPEIGPHQRMWWPG